jgi:integrase
MAKESRISFNLKESSSEKATLIYCIVNLKGAGKIKLSVGFSIKPVNWNFEEQNVKHKEKISKTAKTTLIIEDSLKEIYLRIVSIKTGFENLKNNHQKSNIPITDNDIREMVDKIINPVKYEKVEEVIIKKPNEILFEVIDLLIHKSESGERRGLDGRKISKGTISKYKTHKKSLEDFSKEYKGEIGLSTMDKKFYNDYTTWIKSKKGNIKTGKVGFSKNSVGNYVSTVRTFLHFAISEKYLDTLPYSRGEFKVMQEESDTIYLSELELERIYQYNLSDNKVQSELRDLFILGCYTGLRGIDLVRVKNYHIKLDGENGYINLEQTKTHKAVTIPLLPIAKEILEKYDYILPKYPKRRIGEEMQNVCKIIGLNETVTRTRNTNEDNEVTEHFEKWELVGGHTMRRSFATNMYKRGIDKSLIMGITGHKTTQSFDRYLRLNSIEKSNMFLSEFNKSSIERQAPKVNIKVLTA